MTDRLYRFSETSTFLSNRRQYYLKYILKVEKDYPTDGYRPAFTFDTGNVGHAALAAYYRGENVDAAIDAEVEKQRLDPEDEKVLLGKSAAQRYFAWVEESQVDKGLEVVAVEERLYVPMGKYEGDEVTLTFEPDLIVRDRFDLLHIIDHKFVKQFSSLAGFIATNRQGFTYSMGTEAVYGQPITSFSLNQVQRDPPKTKAFVVADRVTQYLEPDTLSRFRKQLDRVLRDMTRLHQEVEDGDLSGAYDNPGWTCKLTCSDYEICCGNILKSPAETAEIISTKYRLKTETL